MSMLARKLKKNGNVVASLPRRKVPEEGHKYVNPDGIHAYAIPNLINSAVRAGLNINGYLVREIQGVMDVHLPKPAEVVSNVLQFTSGDQRLLDLLEAEVGGSDVVDPVLSDGSPLEDSYVSSIKTRKRLYGLFQTDCSDPRLVAWLEHHSTLGGKARRNNVMCLFPVDDSPEAFQESVEEFKVRNAARIAKGKLNASPEAQRLLATANKVGFGRYRGPTLKDDFGGTSDELGVFGTCASVRYDDIMADFLCLFLHKGYDKRDPYRPKEEGYGEYDETTGVFRQVASNDDYSSNGDNVEHLDYNDVGVECTQLRHKIYLEWTNRRYLKKTAPRLWDDTYYYEVNKQREARKLQKVTEDVRKADVRALLIGMFTRRRNEYLLGHTGHHILGKGLTPRVIMGGSIPKRFETECIEQHAKLQYESSEEFKLKESFLDSESHEILLQIRESEDFKEECKELLESIESVSPGAIGHDTEQERGGSESPEEMNVTRSPVRKIVPEGSLLEKATEGLASEEDEVVVLHKDSSLLAKIRREVEKEPPYIITNSKTDDSDMLAQLYQDIYFNGVLPAGPPEPLYQRGDELWFANQKRAIIQVNSKGIINQDETPKWFYPDPSCGIPSTNDPVAAMNIARRILEVFKKNKGKIITPTMLVHELCIDGKDVMIPSKLPLTQVEMLKRM